MKCAEGRERRRDGRSFSLGYEEEKEGVVRLKMRDTRVVTDTDFAIAALPPTQSGSTNETRVFWLSCSCSCREGNGQSVVATDNTTSFD